MFQASCRAARMSLSPSMARSLCVCIVRTLSQDLAMDFFICSADATETKDPSAEISDRRNYANALYVDFLANKNVTLVSGHIFTEKLPKNPSVLNETTFDPLTYHIQPPWFDSFCAF